MYQNSFVLLSTITVEKTGFAIIDPVFWTTSNSNVCHCRLYLNNVLEGNQVFQISAGNGDVNYRFSYKTYLNKGDVIKVYGSSLAASANIQCNVFITTFPYIEN